jgi:hypothetical protein
MLSNIVDVIVILKIYEIQLQFKYFNSNALVQIMIGKKKYNISKYSLYFNVTCVYLRLVFYTNKSILQKNRFKIVI